jgi:tight adherence protein B
MDVVVAILAGAALLGVFAARRSSHHARRSARLLQRLEVQPPGPARRAPGGPLLEGWAVKVAGTKRGARLQARAESRHPGVPFSDVMALGLATGLGGGLFGLFFFDGMLAAAGTALAAPWAADRFFHRLHGNRAARIEKQLSEALALQANVLRAGQSLSRSLRILAEETRAPMKEELERMLAEVELGRPMEESLERFSARIPSRDVDMWVTAMLVHRQTGGNLAGVMDLSAQRVSQRLQLRSEIRAMTAQGRLSGIVVAVAPLAFFFLLSMGSREQMEFLFSSALGLTILISGLLMNVAGMIWIRHALRVRV